MKIENFRGIGKGHLVGSFDAVFPEIGIRITGCTLFDGQQGYFVRFPQQKNSVGGQTKYADVVSMEKSMKKQFDSACLAELSPYLPKQPASNRIA